MPQLRRCALPEVENAGKNNEREKTPGDDDGFMWRMETWWRVEERDGSVYVQSEVASLTRDIPAGLGWMIKPFVMGIPKESLTFHARSHTQSSRGVPPGPLIRGCALWSPCRGQVFVAGSVL